MKLSVEGYKSIASKRSIEFNGLTVLSGANSSGKSSFMQPFLILKQTIENHYDSGTLVLDGENIKLTDSSQVISKVPNYKNKYFSVSVSNKNSECKVIYRYKRGKGLSVDSVSMENDKFENGLTLKVGMKSEEIEKAIPDEDFKFIKEFYEEKKQKIKWQTIREKCFISAILSTIGKKRFPLRAGIEPTHELENLVTRLIHVPGLRGNPSRTYKIAASEEVYPGSFEKYVASIITEWSKIKKYRANYDLLKKQLEELGLAKNITTEKVNDTSVEIRVSRNKLGDDNNDCVNIADVGFGVSQTIPVLVALICAKKGQLVYIEQPELHLHPKAQFKLAEIIAKAVTRGVKVVIETHSSVLLRGIQILVVKKAIDHEDISLNWFTQNCESGETEVVTAELDEFGAFGDWPEDFDDTSLTVEQMYLDAVEVAICGE
ncbi:AAA family ATPase [Neptunomonas phycophila]|uniref:AAA family ATPase n=1 Tax=Neptunomonas phycophila TaxID=1572645 RepID=UPI003735F2DE